MIAITVIIRDILAVPAQGAYYFDDLTALQANPISVAERYTAEPVTSGFRRVREVAEALAVGLVLDNPATWSGYQVAWGDCVAVEFSGKAGRNPLFRAEEGLSTIQGAVAPALCGRELTGFRELAAEVDALVESVEITRPLLPLRPGGESEEGGKRLSRRELLATPARLLRRAGGEAPTPTEQVTVDRPLHTAIRYGVSQALLAAVALARGVTMAQVVAEEYQLPLLTGPQSPATAGRVEAVPIHAQCGADRYAGADKMIVRRVASLPHTLVDNIPEQLGEDGEILVRYARWLRERIPQLADETYHPTIHLDVHGALGKIYDNNLGKILGFLYRLEQAVTPYPLRVECPLILDSREAQIEALKTLRNYIRMRKMQVQLVADEWANTLEDIRAFVAAGAADMIQVKMPDLGSVHNSIQAVLSCKSAGVGAFLGGSCAETDLSARVAAHIALATRPDMIMAKPGMGVDEGVALVHNEMARTLAWIRAREDRKGNLACSGAEKT